MGTDQNGNEVIPGMQSGSLNGGLRDRPKAASVLSIDPCDPVIRGQGFELLRSKWLWGEAAPSARAEPV